MNISTKKGDDGYTVLLRGERVSKHHLVIEAIGALDEANSLLGLARASSREKRIKRIIFYVQKHLFIIGAEFSVPKGRGEPPKKTITDKELKWLEKLIEEFEEELDLPPGFVAFGEEEGPSHMDVARASIRKLERVAVKMKREDLIENENMLKYLNRLSDLIFVIACFEEKNEEKKWKFSRSLSALKWSDPTIHNLAIFIGSIILSLLAIILLLLIFHRPDPQVPVHQLKEHLEQMEYMHQTMNETEG